MNGLLQTRLEHTRYGYNFAKISPRRQDVPSQQAVQTKLTVGQPGDRYEQEADFVARQVMGMPDVNDEELQMKPLAAAIAPLVQRQCPTCEEESSGDLESQLNSSKGGGSPLPNKVRAFMEPGFGHDFSKVRVHSDRTAVQMNRELGAQAFTHGSDIYYGDGKYPGNNGLTAHELTHVMQQSDRVHKLLK
ncbi:MULTISPECIES: eCIS core domain-containing protein [Nostocales]|uniref:eCIS core domain-containing protein n=1 Tax=Nostocales TaxID=1161 RepID=UPI000512A07A